MSSKLGLKLLYNFDLVLFINGLGNGRFVHNNLLTNNDANIHWSLRGF